jgi:hypothetical protein
LQGKEMGTERLKKILQNFKQKNSRYTEKKHVSGNSEKIRSSEKRT